MRAAHCSAHHQSVPRRRSGDERRRSGDERNAKYVSLKDIVAQQQQEEQTRLQGTFLSSKYETKLTHVTRVPESPVTVKHSSGRSHNDSDASSVPSVTIQAPGMCAVLRDTDELPHRVNLIRRMRLCARKAEVVSGATLGTGARQHYAVYIVECMLPHKGCFGGAVWRVPRRYSDFWRLRSDLVTLERKRARKGQLPPGVPRLSQIPFPPKRWWGNASHDTMAQRLPMLDRFIRAAAALVQGEGDAFLLDQFLRLSENNRPPSAADAKRKSPGRRSTRSAAGSFAKPRSNSLEARQRAAMYAPPSHRRTSNSSDPGIA